MKTNTRFLSGLAVALLLACPALVMAAVPASSPYNTDKTNSYVQDQTSKAMENLNNILCHVSAMDPAEMVGLGPYIALVDANICSPNDGGGASNSTSTGASYKPAIVNSTRTDTSSPMIAKVWLDESNGPGNAPQSIFAYLSATQAPNPPTDPYGRFRLDFCGKQSGSCTSQGFINSTASGLAFFSSDTGDWGMGGASVTQTLQLQLNASSSTAGSGALSQTNTGPGAGGQPDAAFYFAYNADYFMRSDNTGAGGLCFSRDALQAAESVWSYGVYDSTTGERVERNSGFPIEYTDATSGNTMNGYVGYWGLNSPTAITNGATVNKVTYGSGSPTKTPYTLLQTGGKLVKFTKITKILDDLDKVKFQFWPQATVAVTGGTVTPGTGCSSYEVYWDKTPANFKVTGQQDSTNNCNIRSFASAWTMTVANMQTAMSWGLNGWSQMLGGDFNINQTDMTTLSGSTTVVTHIQDIVYPSNFAATFPSGLVCIENCPTAADIALSNANSAAATVLPYATGYTDWNFGTGRAPYSYTLNATTGNLIDGASTAVVSTASQSSGTTGNYGNNNNGIQSGRLAIKVDLDAQVTARGGVANTYLPVDFDQLTTYYQWQTGGNNWNQLSMLYSGSTPVVFDPPLNVDFVVPSGAQYGTYAGATFTLQYGGFGNLWGIPSTCIDISTNANCLPNNATPQQLQRWTPQFSIPTGLLDGKVTVSSNQTGAGTVYLVKALQKEVRLGKVVTSSCTGLTLPTAGSVTLPDNTSWSDPSSSSSSNYVGTKPDFGGTPPAPQVIQGVKMY
jgi:hypothetical protein